MREYVEAWLGGPHGLACKTAERYGELAANYIDPHLGNSALQRLRPAKVAEWHETLLKSGGNGRALSPRTVGHAHRVLHRALQRAVERETLTRNVASAISPPKVPDTEVAILAEEEIATVLLNLSGHELSAIVTVDLATGLRRGEILALPWCNVDLDGALLRVDRSLEETRAGLRFKAPKSVRDRRTISLPPNAVATLREHRRAQLELRMALGLGRPESDALVSYTWRNTCASLKLPKVTFHALRHTHASALIAAGVDVVTISRRLGHSSPTMTLRIYGHLFKKDDSAATTAIEAAMRTHPQR